MGPGHQGDLSGDGDMAEELGEQYQGCGGCTGAGTLQGMGGFTPLAQLQPCPERLQHMCGCLASSGS